MIANHCKWGHDIAVVGRYPTGNCKLCMKIRAADWNRKNYHSKVQRMMRESNWRHDGIDMTVAKYNELFQQQNGRCLICDKHQSELKTRLAVDHDHSTGLIRGLLCFSCNTLYERYLKYKAALAAYEQRGLHGDK